MLVWVRLGFVWGWMGHKSMNQGGGLDWAGLGAGKLVTRNIQRKRGKHCAFLQPRLRPLFARQVVQGAKKAPSNVQVFCLQR